MTNLKRFFCLFVFFFVSLVLFSCGGTNKDNKDDDITASDGDTSSPTDPVAPPPPNNPVVPSDPNYPSDPKSYSSRSYEDSVIKVAFDGATQTVALKDLNKNEIFLVKVNKNAEVAPANQTGGASGYSNLSSSRFDSGDTRRTHAVSEEAHLTCFNGGDDDEFPPIKAVPRKQSRAIDSAPKVKDERDFLVSPDAGGFYETRTATLMAIGEHSYIWVIPYTEEDNPYGGPVSDDSFFNRFVFYAEELAKNFDIIYPLETKLFGYEDGGGPNVSHKIHIVAGPTRGAGGYYGGGEEIYISRSLSIGTVIHEFQHMIHQNHKGPWSPSWYNEGLSNIAQGILGPFIEDKEYEEQEDVYKIEPTYTYLADYQTEGLTEWVRLASLSYSKADFFLRYLTLNYGGPALIRKILANDSYGIESISAALNETTPGMDFYKALSRYGEAFLFSGDSLPEGGVSFDRGTVTSEIEGTTYSLEGFDIGKTLRSSSPKKYGPRIFDLTPTEMRPHSLVIQSSDEWLNKTGEYSITLQKPASDDIELYIMVR